MSKFKETFSEPIYFTTGSYVISGYLSREEAAEAFSVELHIVVTPDQLESDWVRFGFGYCSEDGETKNSWWSGVGKKKGHQPVWVY